MVCGERWRHYNDKICKGYVKIVSVNYRIVYLLVLHELYCLAFGHFWQLIIPQWQLLDLHKLGGRLHTGFVWLNVDGWCDMYNKHRVQLSTMWVTVSFSPWKLLFPELVKSTMRLWHFADELRHYNDEPNYERPKNLFSILDKRTEFPPKRPDRPLATPRRLFNQYRRQFFFFLGWSDQNMSLTPHLSPYQG